MYDVTGAASDRNCVVLNDIHIDIMDYIVPASCTDSEFRQMWAEFEWENKVAVNTNILDLHEFLQHVMRTTNMKCLTPEKVPVPNASRNLSIKHAVLVSWSMVHGCFLLLHCGIGTTTVFSSVHQVV